MQINGEIGKHNLIAFSFYVQQDFLSFLELAEHFDNCGNLCVFYWIELPKFWLDSSNDFSNDIIEKNSLFGITHRCYTNGNDIAHFSAPFDFGINCKNCPEWSEEFIGDWPVLHVQVLSVDFWDREKIESYGSVELPRKAGRHSLAVKTWSILSDSIIDRLRCFFVGSSLENYADLDTKTNVSSESVLCWSF